MAGVNFNKGSWELRALNAKPAINRLLCSMWQTG